MKPKTERTCDICGDEFFTSDLRRRFCSDVRCKIEGRKLTCKEYKLKVAKSLPLCGNCNNAVSNYRSKLCDMCILKGNTVKKKKCSCCKQILPASEFNKQGRGKLMSLCKTCRSIRTKKLYNPHKARARYERHILKEPLHHRIYGIVRHCKKSDELKGFDTSKTVTYEQVCTILQDYNEMTCYLCLNKMSIYVGHKNVITLDRLNNDIGHEPDNVIPCCRHCNSIKNQLTLDMAFRYIIQHHYDSRAIQIKALLSHLNQNPVYPHTKMIEDSI